MNAQQCLTLFREIRSAAFATVDARGRPQVRIIDVMLAEADGLYFLTARGKDFYRELSDGWVAVTALSKNWEMLRLNGRAAPLAEPEKWLDRMFEANPSMNEVYPGDSRSILTPFRIGDAEIEYFDLRRQPIFRESYCIGRWTPQPRGFAIGGDCVRCGKCAAACPQGCISPGAPYRIDPSRCLRCGLCAERCPEQAVYRLGG